MIELICLVILVLDRLIIYANGQLYFLSINLPPSVDIAAGECINAV